MKRAKKERIWELDFLRGFAIILVVFDHLFFDYGSFFSGWDGCGVPFLESLNRISNDYLSGELRFFWRPAFLFLFFSVSGICTALSRNNLFRGLKLWVVAMAVTFVSYLGEVLADTSLIILFGVLHCLGIIIIAYALIELCVKGIFLLIEKLSKKTINDKIKLLVTSLLYLGIFIATLLINFKYNPLSNDVETKFVFTELDGKKFGMFFFSREWWTGDYFPLFPYISFFFFGAFLSKLLYGKKKTLLPLIDGVWNKGVVFAGRHSLIVYLMGQVIGIALGAILSLVFLGNSLLF